MDCLLADLGGAEKRMNGVHRSAVPPDNPAWGKWIRWADKHANPPDSTGTDSGSGTMSDVVIQAERPEQKVHGQ